MACWRASAIAQPYGHRRRARGEAGADDDAIALIEPWGASSVTCGHGFERSATFLSRAVG
jgi:hypothetical protein